MLRVYTQRACIGRGGSGEVFKARLLPSLRTVAVKRLNRECSEDTAHVRRLRHEAAMLGMLEHENIVRLLGLDAHDDRVELVMEYVNGITLEALMRTDALSLPVALHIVRSLLHALAHAHRAGIVHRDISPRNVLISWDGAVKLTDFGLAKPHGGKPTTGGGLRGTLPYASPEQLRGRDADRRSDLFALGVILYELLARRCPWEGSPTHVIFQLTVKRQRAASLTETCPWFAPGLARAVERLLALEPVDRYQSAGDALAALPDIDGGADQLARVMSSLRRDVSPGGIRASHARTVVALVSAFMIGYWLTADRSTSSPSSGELVPAYVPVNTDGHPPPDPSHTDESANDHVQTEPRSDVRPDATAGDVEYQSPRGKRHKPARPFRESATHDKRPYTRAQYDAPMSNDVNTTPPVRGGSIELPSTPGGTIYSSEREKP